MTPAELLQAIKRLPAKCEVSTRLDRRLDKGPVFQSQKEHWIGWIAHGFMRSETERASTVYNRLQCPPMVLWLPEAAGVASALIRRAELNCLMAQPNVRAQCGAIRRTIPWATVETALRVRR